jgi:hypothetical protein
VSNNVWTHIVGIIRGATDMDLYVNEVNIGGTYSGTGGSIAYGSDSARIGQGNSSLWSSFPFNGKIDDVRIYNRALSADEIKRLYNIGATAKLGVTANNDSLAEGLVGWWNFDGKTVSGTRVFDASGTGNYGTMTNGPTVTEGKLGQGMAFDGGDDFVRINDAASLQITNNFTIALWFKSDNTSQSQKYIYTKNIAGGGGFQYALIYEYVDNTIEFFGGSTNQGHTGTV